MSKFWVLNITLLDWQRQVDASPARFKYVRCGKRTGKTKYGRKWLLDGIPECEPNQQVVYIAPTKVMARDISWNEYKAFIPAPLIQSISEQRLEITFKNGAILAFRGSDDPDSLRGKPYRRAWLDEAAFHKPEGWDIVRSQLMDFQGKALFTTTPNGSNWYRRDEEAAKNKADCACFHFTPYDNTFLPTGELDAIKADLIAKGQEDTWKQEYLAEYVDKIGQVYWEFNEAEHTADADLMKNTTHFVRGMDWGIQDNTACIWIGVMNNGGLWVADEHVKNNTNISDLAMAILHKSSGKIIHATVLDSSAFRRESDFSSVARRFATLGVRALPATKDPDLGISAIKELLQSGKLIISRRCANLIDGLKSWNYDKHEPDSCAAFRYGISYLVSAKHVKLNSIIAPPAARSVAEMLNDRLTQAQELAKLERDLQRNTYGGRCFKVINSSRW